MNHSKMLQLGHANVAKSPHAKSKKKAVA